MTQRLNNSTRAKITRRALAHRFGAEVRRIVADQIVFTEKVYEDVYSKKQRDALYSLPEGWFPEASSIRIVAPEHTVVTFNGGYGLNNETMSLGFDNGIGILRRRVPHKDYMVPTKKAYEADHEISKQNEALADRRHDLEERILKASTLLKGSLNSVTTLGKLLSEWPELEPFCKGLYPDAPKLPAVRRSELNAILDLPVDA